jgi:hypothetical protein
MATKVYLLKRYTSMKRDMDLVRALLARIENDERLNGADAYVANEFEMPGHSAEEVGYHVLLLHDAGFLQGNTETPSSPMIERLTWHGCEFLDDTRDPEVWAVVTRTAKSAGGVGVALLWELAKAELKKKLGLA